jgi:predicted histidine transporter YuiF (NhaC family)
MKENIVVKNMEMAYEAINEHFPKNDKDEVLKEYKGYIASFCTTLRQLGLMAALLNYYESEIYQKEKDSENQTKTDQEKKSKNKAQSHYLVSALAKMSNEKDTLAFMNTIYTLAIQNDKTAYKKMEKEIAEYAITLKKTLRLFKIQS